MPQSAESLMRQYEKASDCHDLDTILPMIADDAIYFFSNESVHLGKAEVESALRHNFDMIKDEAYAINNLTWLVESEHMAACAYDYVWSGTINGEAMSGSGRGTNVLKRIKGEWQIVHEHLSRGRFIG